MTPDLHPRYYQRECLDAVLFGWEFERILHVALGTGAGKTIIALMVILASRGKRVLFVADADSLCFQPLATFARYGIIAALEKASDRASLGARVVVASEQTLANPKRLERYSRNHFDIVLTDEIHRSTDRGCRITAYFETAQVCGFTATPFRQGKADLTEWYGPVAYEMLITNLIEQGFSPTFDCVRFPISVDLANIKQTITPDGKDYDLNALETTIAPYYAEVADLLKKHASHLHTLAYLPLIKSSESFAAICRSKGLTAVHVDGKTDNLKEILLRFEAGEIQVLCNASILSTGVDLRRADGFLNLSPIRSMNTYQQRFGRTMRTLEGTIDDLPEENQAAERRERIKASKKPSVTVFDLLWQHDDLSVIRPEHLVCKTTEEARFLISKTAKHKSDQDMIETAKRILKQREEALRKKLEKASEKTKSKLLDPVQVGELLNNARIRTYIPGAKWEDEPPISAQIHQLTELGVNPESIKTKGAANALIGELVCRRTNGLSSLKQIKLLLQLEKNLPFHEMTKKPECMSFRQIGAIIQGHFDRHAKKRRPAFA